MSPEISVIITTLNREQDIGLTIERLLAQNLAPELFEILVVDGGSTDQSEAVVQSLAEQHPAYNIRFLVELEPGVTAARHLGVREARGAILTFIEDDARAEPGALAAVRSGFANPEVHLLGGRCIPDYDETPPAWLETFFERWPGGFRCGSLSLIDLGDRVHETSPHNVWALNFSIRKSTLLELGGFHPDLMPPGFKEFQGDGESGVSHKLEARSYKTLYHPDVTVHHRIQADRFDVAYFEKRYRFQGICDSYTALRNGSDIEDESAAVVPGRARSLIRLLLSPGQFLKVLFNKVRGIFGRHADPGPGREYYQRALAAYREGFAFHRNAVKENPRLLEWIRLPDYFDQSARQYRQEEALHD